MLALHTGDISLSTAHHRLGKVLDSIVTENRVVRVVNGHTGEPEAFIVSPEVIETLAEGGSLRDLFPVTAQDILNHMAHLRDTEGDDAAVAYWESLDPDARELVRVWWETQRNAVGMVVDGE
jgi:hypothetical protein